MSILVPFNGSTFVIPTPNEIGWGTNLDNYLVAIANGCLQNIGGNFTLSNDVDFGGTNGIKAIYYKTRSSNIAGSGQFRLANAVDSISWRDFGNTTDLPLTVNSSNQLTFNGSPLSVGGSGTVSPGIQYQLAYYATSTDTVNGLALITASKALQSDINGLPIASNVTDVELNYLSGVTSAIQTQFTSKKSISTGNNFKFETTDGSGNLQETTVTALRAVATDSNGLPIASSTTAAELAFVNGVTSSIQTQLNNKFDVAGTGLTATGTTISLSTPVTTTNGGTGLNTFTQGDLIYSNASNSLTSLSKNTSATRYLSNTGTSNNPAWAQVNLANGVTGTLPAANGGSGTSGKLVATGLYTGNGTSLSIAHGMGAAPDLVIITVIGATSNFPTIYINGAGNGRLFDGQNSTTSITSVTSSNINIGSESHVNTNGSSYTWIAIKAQ